MMALIFAATAMAEGFTFAVASPVASQEFRFKTAAFVFRTEGCAEPEKAEVSATAEGLVNGMRRTMELKVVPGSKPGVYAVPESWPSEGKWVVNLKGTCAKAAAGALIPMGPRGFIREASKFFPRPANDSEIQKALKETAGGDK
jgi:hypothetical protein